MSQRAKERIRRKKLDEERDALEKAINYYDNYSSNLADREEELRKLKKLHPKTYEHITLVRPQGKNETTLDYYARLVHYIRMKHKPPGNNDSAEHDRRKGKGPRQNLPRVVNEPYW